MMETVFGRSRTCSVSSFTAFLPGPEVTHYCSQRRPSRCLVTLHLRRNQGVSPGWLRTSSCSRDSLHRLSGSVKGRRSFSFWKQLSGLATIGCPVLASQTGRESYVSILEPFTMLLNWTAKDKYLTGMSKCKGDGDDDVNGDSNDDDDNVPNIRIVCLPFDPSSGNALITTQEILLNYCITV